MIVLGNIVIDKSLLNNDKIINVNKGIINIVEDYSLIDNNIPTLFIGWKNVKKLFKNKASILNKRIGDKIFWTFLPTEKIQDFNEDIDKFVELLNTDFVKGIKYRLIDPIIENDINIINLLPTDINSLYVNDRMIYGYSDKEKMIYGIDLTVFEFLGVSNDKLINELKNKFDFVIIENYENDSAIYKYNKIFKINNLDRYIPYITYRDKLLNKIET